jgi:stage V sporulation protein AC
MTRSKYLQLVDELAPRSKVLTNCVWAFFVGGSICVAGQFLKELFVSRGINEADASTMMACALIAAAVFFTAFGWYGKLGKTAGAGSVVPITGFANAMAAPAIEYKNEGLVLGVGAKMFTVAGPVIVYGAATSALVGLFYYFFHGR